LVVYVHVDLFLKVGAGVIAYASPLLNALAYIRFSTQLRCTTLQVVKRDVAAY